MATPNAASVANGERLTFNPWLWIIVGFVCALAVFGWAQFLGDSVPFLRLFITFFGFLATGVALWMRLQSQQESFLVGLPDAAIQPLVGLLMIVFGALGMGLFGCLLSSIFGAEWVPWRPGSLVVVNILTLPTCIVAVRLLWKNWNQQASLDKGKESAILLLAAALNCWLFSWALYVDSDPLSWDTIQLMFGVFALVALLAAPLVAVTQTVRRVMITLFVVVHFGGILTAVFAAPPAPNLIIQLWVRIYRPYLEFMYLNNAYHFYAPDPGPANYLWFRLVYEDKNGDEYGEWHKIPNMSDDGWHRHPTSLVYSRMLAQTERASQTIATPPFVIQNANGNPALAKFYERRKDHADVRKLDEPSSILIIPFHNAIPQIQQYGKPNRTSQELINTYAKHVARIPHPKMPKAKFKYSKIYRVRHELPTVPGPYLDQWLPNDPMTYRAFYVGDYDEDGNLINPENPFLNWLLPTLRRERKELIDHARRHAGDPEYIYRYTEKGGVWMRNEKQ